MIFIPHDNQFKPIFGRLLQLLVGVLVVLFVVLELLLWSHYRWHSQNNMTEEIREIAENLQFFLKEQAHNLETLEQVVVLDSHVLKVLKESNSELLLMELKSKFDAMLRQNRITQFSFYDTNLTTMLRLHDSNRRGDTAEHSTLLSAKRSGQFTWGLEIEEEDIITLRAVHPIYESGTLLGYVEFGKKIDDFLETLEMSLHSQAILLIPPKYSTKQIWEKNTQLHNHFFMQNKHAQDVLGDTSFPFLSDDFLKEVESLQSNTSKEASIDGIDWLFYKHTLYDIAGKKIGNLLILHDISEMRSSYLRLVFVSGVIVTCILIAVFVFIYLILKQAHGTLIEKQEGSGRLHKIASRISGVIYQYRLRPDGSACVPYASEAIRQIFRLSADEVKEDASKIFTLLHPDDAQGVFESIQESASHLSIWLYEFRIYFEDGTIRWLHGNAIPEKEEDGSVLWHGYIDDVTDRRFMENELKALNELLDAQVEKEVMARVQIEKEQESERQMLIQKSKLSSMGEMMGAIAHQWRQPLNALNINIQNLDDDCDEGLIDRAFIDEFIKKNKQIILFMSKTIDDFRNFFKIDKEKKEFSALEAVYETIGLQMAQLANHSIDIDVDGEDMMLFGFRGEFQQVILNIINNAKDTILEQRVSPGSIRIILAQKEIAIENNGGNIPEGVLERIFEPYYTTKTQGVGIGLYMSKVIIEKNMGWKLTAENVAHGARFTIIFSA